ncbi:hypothetical protein PENSTE_c026G01638 [Penicillium steckii]|uniref:Uncharacterized protein n=1 Tax=Penicillium steckii TaxID=303698 RepID=A0A1V6SQK4_9EURO|nr:hypothetical protein PENSTE_c026G01638 [Penicillium steckii]
MNFKLLSGLFSAFVCFFALADAAPAVNTGRIVVGYRVVDVDEANAWKDNGNRPLWSFKKSGSIQLGAGTYLTDINGGWPVGGSRSRYCVVTANAGEFGKLKKVWFPNMLTSKENPDMNELAYSQCDLDRNIYDTYGLQPRETLRVSDVLQDVKQVLLPAEIVNATNSALDLQSMCSDTIKGVQPNVPVNFDDWGLLGK